MKKKIVGLLSVVTLLIALIAIPTAANAATTATVTITATPQYLAITINGGANVNWSVGTVAADSTYWQKGGSEPSWPIADADCSFTLANAGSVASDIDVKGTNFTGGVGWTLTTGSPGENTVRVTAYASGMQKADGKKLTTSDQEFVDNLAASGTKKGELSLETGTFTDGEQKSSTVTFTIRVHS